MFTCLLLQLNMFSQLHVDVIQRMDCLLVCVADFKTMAQNNLLKAA
jgi:hypothetical protein